MTWPGSWIHPFGLMVDIVLQTMIILKDYSDFINFIFQKGSEGISKSTCVSAVWERGRFLLVQKAILLFHRF